MSQEVEVNKNIIEMQYAVRGAIPKRAMELQKMGRQTIACNIGNPQALGQKPISYYREVIGLLEDPSRIKIERKIKEIYKSNSEVFDGFKEDDMLSDYVLNLAEDILLNIDNNLGAYSESKGFEFIRKAIATFIDKRDHASETGIYADYENIFLTNGASVGAQSVIESIISNPKDGIMIPIPQYPLYSATIKRSGGEQVNYYLDEENGWTINREILDASFKKATDNGIIIKAIVVINPGNPTGSVLGIKSIEDILQFAEDNQLSIIADEVYQENLYGEQFFSFASVAGKRDIPIFSLHSISKGFVGECGHRGGYLDVRNAPIVKNLKMPLTDLFLKQSSINLCANTIGQILTYLMVTQPEKNSNEYERFFKEKTIILTDLHEKALMIKEAFKQMDGLECFGSEAGMYLFPRINKLPTGSNCFDYCMNLLEETGICTVNGDGFGQKEGTSHFRIAFLPPKELLKEVLPKWVKFHNRYINS